MAALPDSLSELYPFTPRQFPTLWGQLSYVDEGEGEPVILVHGNPTWSFFYRDLIVDLAEHGFRAIAPDHLGCGLSDKPQAGFNYTLGEHIDNLVSLVEDHLELPSFHLVVHDWGGAIGMALAARFPKRIRRIHILNTAAWSAPRLPKRIALCKTPIAGEWFARGLNAFALAATRMCTVKPLPPEVRAGYLYPYDTWANRIATHRFVKDIPLRPAHPSWARLKEVENALPQLRHQPMQICWGLRDWCFDEKFLDEWIARFPEARVERYPNAAHYLLEDAGEEIIPQIRDFLSA
ncbi:MAG: alpha/beta fold hydrolase [Opitutales bacterium]